MPVDWSPFVEFVRSHQRFVIMTHVRPDGDALGSEIGLACALRQFGKQVRVAVASDLGPRYEFANAIDGPIERFQAPGDEYRDADAIIVVDTGTWSQLGEFGAFMRSMTCGEGGHRPPPDAGRPGRAAVRGHYRRGRRPAGVRGDAGARRAADDPGGQRHVPGPGHGHRLVPALVGRAADVRPGRGAGPGRGEADAALRRRVRPEHAGPDAADRPGPRADEGRGRRSDRAHGGAAGRLRRDRGRARRTPRT